MVNYLALTYSLSVIAVVAVAVYAFSKGYILRRKIQNTESFLTARNEVGYFRIAWSFYAGAMGAWVLSSPASYATIGGMLGLVMYSLAAGLPFIMIAFAGNKIQANLPHVLSLTDYVGWRFGLVAKTLVVIIALFNMSIAMLAEYVTIGSIFSDFVGSVSYPMVIVIGLLALTYTTYGGLLVSIYTDTVQGVSSVLLFLLIAIYMTATFRPVSLPLPMPCSPDDMWCISGTPDCDKFEAAGIDCPVTGYSSILTMPVSLFTATIFSEAMWQRAWASRDRRTLHIGAIIGSSAVIIMVFFAGLCGLLGAWAGLITYDTNINLYLFQVLAKGKTYVAPVYNWIGAVSVVLACIMNEGAVDSLQNGMAAGFTSYVAPMVEKKWNIKWNIIYTRILVFFLNLFLMGIAIWLTVDTSVNVGVLELFLITNMLCSSTAIPVLMGVANFLHPYFGGISFVFSSVFSIFSICIYGVHYYFTKYPCGFIDPWVPGRSYNGQSFNSAMFYTWIGNGYQWQFFLVPLCVSVGCVGVSILINFLWSIVNAPSVDTLPGFVPEFEKMGHGGVDAIDNNGSDGSSDGKEDTQQVNDKMTEASSSNELKKSTTSPGKGFRRFSRHGPVILTIVGCFGFTMFLFLLFLVNMDPICPEDLSICPGYNNETGETSTVCGPSP